MSQYSIRYCVGVALCASFTTAQASGLLLWQHLQQGTPVLYQMQANHIERIVQPATLPSALYHAVAFRDFDHNGSPDVLFRHQQGGNYLHLMQQTEKQAVLKVSDVADNNWYIAGEGDLNGDGHQDIIWRHRQHSTVWIHQLYQGQLSHGYALKQVSKDWLLAAVADLDGNGYDDLVWRNQISGANWVYLMGENGIQSLSLNSIANQHWQISQAADINGDGRSDLIWRHQNSQSANAGQVWVYQMNGAQITQSYALNQVTDLQWQLVASADFNQDQQADLVWRHNDTGLNYLYQMQEGHIQSANLINQVDATQWRLVGAATLQTTDAPHPGASLYQQQCQSCHGEQGEGNSALNIQPLSACVSCTEDFALSQYIAAAMPFGNPDSCDQDCANTLSDYIRNVLLYQPPTQPNLNDPGEVVLRRLNQREFDRSVADLFGTSLQLGQTFLVDNVGQHFDNTGQLLSLSPDFYNEFFHSAEQLAADIIQRNKRPYRILYLEAEQSAFDTRIASSKGSYLKLHSNGSLYQTIQVPVSGDYLFTLNAWQDAAGSESAKMQIALDGAIQTTMDVHVIGYDNKKNYNVALSLTPGEHQISISFINDYNKNGSDRNLYLDWYQLVGPQAEAAQASQFACDPEQADCLETLLRDYALYAWRRPIHEDELSTLLSLSLQGAHFYQQLEIGLIALLTSPHFLFRIEQDPALDATEMHPLNSYELATRLSYFLWNSAPNAELLQHAEDGLATYTPQQFEAVLDSLLADPRSDTLATSFAAQWLDLNNLMLHEVDTTTFPDWSETLRQAMYQETVQLFAEFLHSELLPVTDILRADFSYLTPALAQHYGIQVSGDAATTQRVSLLDVQRRGLLGHGSILTMNAHPSKTALVKRGSWILKNLLCTDPPPAPAVIEPLEDDIPAGLTLRQQFELHRANPVCASCHSIMDPLGFALERYDGIGAFRTLDNNQPIDTQGQLPDGTLIDGLNSLAQVLNQDPRFAQCIAQNLMVYALGRDLTDNDQGFLNQIMTEWQASDFVFRDLVKFIARSIPFQYRRSQVTPEEVNHAY